LPFGSAKADVHFAGLKGGRFDVRGKDGKSYAILSAPGLAVNARFKETSFTLPSSDIRSLAIKRVHGSILSEAFINIRLPSGSHVHVHYSPIKQFVAHVQVVNDEYSTGLWLDLRSERRITFEDKVHIAMVQASRNKAALNVVDGAWNVTVTPGIYRLANGGIGQRVDLNLIPMPAAFTSPISPHGLVGQSLHDDVAIQGSIDQYKPDAKGEYATSAQGEGAIEGSIEDYEVKDGPFSTVFRFDRFDATVAAPRDTSLLSGKKLPLGTRPRGIAHSDTPEEASSS